MGDFMLLFLVWVFFGYLEVEQFKLYSLIISLGGNEQCGFCFSSSRSNRDRVTQMWNHVYRGLLSFFSSSSSPSPTAASPQHVEVCNVIRLSFIIILLMAFVRVIPRVWDWYLAEWQHSITMPFFPFQLKSHLLCGQNISCVTRSLSYTNCFF